jgi:hypothetical protein
MYYLGIYLERLNLIFCGLFCNVVSSSVHIVSDVKVKSKVVPELNKVSRHEDVWGSAGIAPPFLSSVLYGGEWSASHSSCFTLPGKIPRYPLDRRLDAKVIENDEI